MLLRGWVVFAAWLSILSGAVFAQSPSPPAVNSPLDATARAALLKTGEAKLAAGDYVAAGRALIQLASFDDPEVGLPARFLLARTHQLGGELPEAAASYEAVLKGYAADGAKPRSAEVVPAAMFYMAELRADEGRWAEAVNRLAPFNEEFAQHRLATDAQKLTARCIDVLAKLPPGQFTGDLGNAPLLVAENLLKTLPANTDDALAAAAALQQCEKAIELLDGWIAANPSAPATSEALLKLGRAHATIADILFEPRDKEESLRKALAAFQRVNGEFQTDPLRPNAKYELAKVSAALGDFGTAISELNKFKEDRFKNLSIAPLALKELAAIHRQQRRAAEAVQTIELARSQYEPAMSADPNRQEEVNQLRHEHGLSLVDAGKPAEGSALLEPLAADKKNPLRPQALCDAAQAQVALKQPAAARKHWQQVIDEFPDSRWAELAQAKLAELPQ